MCAVRPRFLKCGAYELIFASEKRALVNWISKFRGLRAIKSWTKIETVEAKISISFFKKGVLWTFPPSKGSLVDWLLSPFAWNWTLQTMAEMWKEGRQGHTSLSFFLSRSLPLGALYWTWQCSCLTVTSDGAMTSWEWVFAVNSSWNLLSKDCAQSSHWLVGRYSLYLVKFLVLVVLLTVIRWPTCI